MEKIYLEFGERCGIALRLLAQALFSLAKKLILLHFARLNLLRKKNTSLHHRFLLPSSSEFTLFHHGFCFHVSGSSGARVSVSGSGR